MNACGVATLDRSAATDDELVESVRCGDDRAFEELYRRHRPAVVAFVRGRLRDAGAAEDVTQEAFTSALRRMRQTDAAIAFRAWIYEIARNASIDHHRRRSRVHEVSIDAGPSLAAADSARLTGGTAQPDQSALGRERFEHLRGALAELSDTHNRVIVLRELEGLSYHEIGQRMELSPAAVESTLFRARRRLEHEYAELDSGRRCRLVDAAIGRIAGGGGSDRDRRRLARHARRCAGCRRRARSCGVEPLEGRGARAAAALLPLPAFLRDRMPGAPSSSPTGGSGASLAPMLPSLELPATFAGKTVALLATAMLVGGGGATLGGVGPLAPEGAEVRGGSSDRSGDGARARDGEPGGRSGALGEGSAGNGSATGASERALGAATGPVRAGDSASAGQVGAGPGGTGPGLGGSGTGGSRGSQDPAPLGGEPGVPPPGAPALPAAPDAAPPSAPEPSALVLPRSPEAEIDVPSEIGAPAAAPQLPPSPPASAPPEPVAALAAPAPSLVPAVTG